MSALTFGVVPGAGLDAECLARLEELPVDALWMGGHVASPNPSPEVMMALAVLAARTRRVRVGTSILLLPLYTPAIVAKQVADLDRVTGGRVTLGVGIGGEYPGEFRACRVPIEERGPRTDEAIPLLRRLWTGEPVTHDGRFYAMDDVRIHPAPAQPGGPPIVVAGRQRPAMRRAARLGDGWMPYLYSPRRYAESVAVIREHAERGGRSLDRFEWCAFVFVGLHADSEQARADTARFLGGTYRQDFRSMVEHVAAVGDVDEVTASLQRFVDAGARHLIFAPASPDPGATIERLFDDVVPRLRAAA
ncbi:MAG TPA: LLM class flavin-dependent oxidoreductase [Acidimicrobiia bacterium]|nr:LLM class flavin-dependent oxidoreductase [Acidimicrobiia bacterium]